VALANGLGGRSVVQFQSVDLSAGRVRETVGELQAMGVRCLWLLDRRRLKLTKTTTPRQATIGELETELLRQGEPLIYLNALTAELTVVRPRPEALALLGHVGGKLGRVQCEVRSYPLSALTLREGHWHVDSSFDGPSPPWGPLPVRLAKIQGRLRSEQLA
jgi:hypothetical protein